MSAQRVTALSEEFVELTLRHDPVAATMAGIHDYDLILPDDSPEGIVARTEWLRDFSRRLDAVSPAGLGEPHRTDLAILRTRIAALRSDYEVLRIHTRYPSRFVEWVLTGIFVPMTRPFAPLDERKESVLARLMAVPDYLRALRANFGEVPELAVRIGMEVTIAAPAFVDEVARTLLKSFAGERERVEHAAERARLGFLRFHEYLERELLPRAGGSIAIGADALRERLRGEHLMDDDLEALEQLGLEHIDRTRAELEAEARRLDPDRTWREQIESARTRTPDPSRLREAYAAETERARAFLRDRRLVPLVDRPIEVVDTPVFQRSLIPYAAYLPAGPFDSDPTAYLYVTPVDFGRPKAERQQQLEGHCHAQIPTVVIHEAYPGHHLQFSHAHRSPTRLRQLAENLLFVEGWALYCEELMVEHGFAVDPATRLFQLRDLLFRACRVVLDVRIQTGRTTYPEAVEFLVEQAMLEPVNAAADVKWYAIWPTQPLSYLVGKRQILELREEARRRMGERFDLHDFHGALLGMGAGPPGVLREGLWERLAGDQAAGAGTAGAT